MSNLLKQFIEAYPAQPATAFWRAFEVQALAKAGLPSGRGLDLGCGDGKLTAILLSLTGERRLVGVDPDPLETEAARKFPFYETVHTCFGDAIPEPDNAFDFVISNSVLEHIPNLGDVIGELGRVLKPGGRFYFTVPAPPFHANLYGDLIPIGSRERYYAYMDRRLMHCHYLDQAGWTTLCAAHGLTVERCRGYLARPETRRWETVSRFTGGLLYNLAGGRTKPVDIQRKLGLRQLQNRGGLPEPLASIVTAVVGVGFSERAVSEPWRDNATSSCLLVEGSKA
jgi:SAM-dependent methyltransferase